MTPAIYALKRARIPYRLHEYHHDPAASSYGLEAAQALGVDAAQVLKTLIAKPAAGALVAALIPVSTQLNLKAVAQAVGVKKAVLADPREAERVTGYVVGGISPLGQRRRLVTLIDESALSHASVYVSAGRRGLDIALSPQDLVQLTQAQVARIAV